MNSADGPRTDALADRMTAIEMLLMHLQQTVQDLDQVIVDQHKQIETLERKLGRLQSDVTAVRNAAVEDRKPEDEKPPHY